VLETDPLGFGDTIVSWEITNIFEITDLDLYQVHINYSSNTKPGQATRVIDKPKILQKFRNEQLKKLNI
jgi:hypothetical protein